MEDRFSKYFQLSFNIFFTFLGFLVALLLVMLGLKYMFKLLDYIPWFVYVYMLFIIIVPGSLFITVFIIYFKRTFRHPSAAARVISYCIFTVALIFWAASFILDIIKFFKTGAREISSYYSYNIFLLGCSVALIFLVGILQALTTKKEEDWMERKGVKDNIN